MPARRQTARGNGRLSSLLMGTANAQPNPQPGTSAAAPAGSSSRARDRGVGRRGEPQVIDHTGGLRPAKSHADPGRTTNDGSPGKRTRDARKRRPG